MKILTKEIMQELFIRYPILESSRKDIEAAFEVLLRCAQNRGAILVCGNGGSASDAEHIVGELMKGFRNRRALSEAQKEDIRKSAPNDAEFLIDHLQQALPAVSLVSQSALVTAYSNDVEPSMVFAQQVFGYQHPNNVLIGITTSGGSQNVLNAVKVANAFGMKSILLQGNRHPENRALAAVTICVEETEVYKVQELHLPIYHMLCAAVESEIF